MLQEESRAARRRKDSVSGRRVSGDKVFMANQYFAGWKQPGYSYGAAVLMARCETGAAKAFGLADEEPVGQTAAGGARLGGSTARN